MAPLLHTLISRIVLGQTKRSRPDLPWPSSITFSEGDFPGGHQHDEGYPSQPSSLGGSPTQGPQGAGLVGNSSAPGSSGQSLTLDKTSINSQAQPESNGHSPQGRQQGQDASSAPVQASSLQSQSTLSERDAAPSTSDDEHHGQSGAHGYNGTKDDSSVAAAIAGPSSDPSQLPLLSATNNNNMERVAEGNVTGTDSSARLASDSAGLSHDAELSATNQDGFAELVQGTKQFLGMLGARDIS